MANANSLVTSSLGPHIQRFFLDRLIRQRQASAQTIATYRDGFRLLLEFAERRLQKSAAELVLADLDAPLILAFLDHLEKERQNSPRSRNARLAAIRSFVRFVGAQDPVALGTLQPILSIPPKRFERPLVGFLSRKEIDAIMTAPDSSTWVGRRDRVMLATLYNTGARVSELTGMRQGDVTLDSAPSVRIHGKGRKQRQVPLWRSTAAQIRSWLRESPMSPERPLFPTRNGHRLTRAAVTERLQQACRTASSHCPELAKKRPSPHVLRHTTAMHLLQAGVEITVIALWLGHENPATTHHYIEADLAMKERALKKLDVPRRSSARYIPPDSVLAFLQSL